MARLHGFLFWLALAMSAPAVAQAGHDDDDDRPARSGRHEPALKQNPDGTETDADDDDRPAASSPNAPGPIRDRPESGDSTVGAEDHDRQVTSNAVPPKADEVRQRTGPDPDIDHDDDDEQRAPATAIVVTARRLDTARTAIDQGLGATIYELHNETIENRPGGETGSVAAILAQAPGVTLSSEGPNIRGSTAVELRINGAIVPEAISDPADRLSSRLAESTRTITGTLPAQFGFAPGGVIAVTTKNGLYQPGGEGELFAGNHGAFEPAFEFGASTGSSSLFASGSYETADAPISGLTGPVATEHRREFGGLAFADHIIDDENRLSVILGGSDERRKMGQTDLPPGVEETGDLYALATFQHGLEGFTLQTSLFAGHAVDSADFAAHRSERRSTLGTQVDSSLETGGANTVRGGLLLTHLTSAESPATFPGLERTSLSAYLQDEWKPVSSLTINAGVRADWLRSIGESALLQPRASVVWEAASGLSAHVG